jgi:hypothetical protein
MFPVDATRGPSRRRHPTWLVVILAVNITAAYAFCFVCLRLHSHASPYR